MQTESWWGMMQPTRPATQTKPLPLCLDAAVPGAGSGPAGSSLELRGSLPTGSSSGPGIRWCCGSRCTCPRHGWLLCSEWRRFPAPTKGFCWVLQWRGAEASALSYTVARTSPPTACFIRCRVSLRFSLNLQLRAAPYSWFLAQGGGRVLGRQMDPETLGSWPLRLAYLLSLGRRAPPPRVTVPK